MVSSRIPFALSTFGWLSQSDQTMQWKRLVVGAGSEVYFCAHCANWSE